MPVDRMLRLVTLGSGAKDQEEVSNLSELPSRDRRCNGNCAHSPRKHFETFVDIEAFGSEEITPAGFARDSDDSILRKSANISRENF